MLPQNFKGQSSICFLFIITILQAKSSTPGCTVVWAYQHLDTYTTAAQCLEMWHSFSFHIAFHRWWDIEYIKLIKCVLVFLWTATNEGFFSASGFWFHTNFTQYKSFYHQKQEGDLWPTSFWQCMLSRDTTFPFTARPGDEGPYGICKLFPCCIRKPLLVPAAKEGYFLELCASQEVSSEIFSFEGKV